MKSSRGSVHQGKKAKDAVSLVKPMHKNSCAATSPGHWQREDKVNYRNMRRVWGWWLWGQSQTVSCQDSFAELFPILQQTSFSGNPSLNTASTLGEAIAPPTEITLAPQCGA